MSTADHVDIASLLKGKTPVGTHVTVRGWVRTRRDSKAGLSFIHLHDGSCFDPIQVVAPAQLPNYESEIKKLTSGCAVIATRRRWRRARDRGRRSRCRPRPSRSSAGWTTRKLSDSAEASVVRVPPRSGAPAAAHEHAWRGRARAPLPEHGRCIATSTSTASSGCTRRSSPRAMPRAPARCSASARSTWRTCGAIPRTPDGRADFSQDFFGKRSVSHRQRSAERRDVLPARCRRSTPSGRRSAPRTATPAATSPSSGWSSPRSRSPICAADADLAESFLKYIFTALLNERGDDLKFFAERIDKGCVARARSVRRRRRSSA